MRSGSTSSPYGGLTTDGIPRSSKPSGMNRYGACWNRLTFIRPLALPSGRADRILSRRRVRTAYLGRLHRGGVKLVPHWALVSTSHGSVRFRNVFAEELETEFDAGVLVISHGRVPDDGLSLALTEHGIPHRAVGDCRSPRGIEEAVLEGTVAVRELLSDRS